MQEDTGVRQRRTPTPPPTTARGWEKAAVLAALLASCAEPPAPKSPEPWQLKEAQDREDAAKRARYEAPPEPAPQARALPPHGPRRGAAASEAPAPLPGSAVGGPAMASAAASSPPAGGTWTGALDVAPPAVLARMSPAARHVWALYGAMPPERRTFVAFRDAEAEALAGCGDEAQCRWERRTRASYYLQHRFPGSVAWPHEDRDWVTTGPNKEACVERSPMYRTDPNLPQFFAGIMCFNLVRSAVTGKTIVRDEVFSRW